MVGQACLKACMLCALVMLSLLDACVGLFRFMED